MRVYGAAPLPPRRLHAWPSEKNQRFESGVVGLAVRAGVGGRGWLPRPVSSAEILEVANHDLVARQRLGYGARLSVVWAASPCPPPPPVSYRQRRMLSGL